MTRSLGLQWTESDKSLEIHSSYIIIIITNISSTWSQEAASLLAEDVSSLSFSLCNIVQAQFAEVSLRFSPISQTTQLQTTIRIPISKYLWFSCGSLFILRFSGIQETTELPLDVSTGSSTAIILAYRIGISFLISGAERRVGGMGECCTFLSLSWLPWEKSVLHFHLSCPRGYFKMLNLTFSGCII